VGVHAPDQVALASKDLAVQPRSAFDAKAVTSQVVMAARCAHETARRVCLQPSFAFATVPNAVLGTEHPSPPFTIQDREVADRKPEGSSLKAAVAALVDQQAIARLGVGKGIDGHVESIARRLARLQGSRPAGCRIR
jgi:hypothetical protein